MKGRLQLWGWPALILGLGLYGLVWFYQEAARMNGTTSQNRATFEVLKSAATDGRMDTLFDARVLEDTMPPISPFGQPVPPRPKAATGVATVPTWVRPNLQLKGTVGSQAATLITAKGEKRIVREGDNLDSALILRILPGRVTLKDAHGTFDITSQE
jgi:hypothetical protein